MAVDLTMQTLQAFADHLALQERSPATIQKYRRDLKKLYMYAVGGLQDKNTLIAFKEHLLQQGYAPASINSALAAINQYLKFMGAANWQLRFLKVQRQTFRSRQRELTDPEYRRLVDCARGAGNERMALLIQTLGSTGIRVSELRSITTEAVHKGQARIRLKGKIRVILLPRKLCSRLRAYCARCGIQNGPVFVTRTGRPMDRSNIGKMLKKIARAAGVRAQKVFPHNLRHLFAVAYYKKYKDVVRLADVLGHSSIDTTRIYTANSAREQQQRLDNLCLLL